VDLDLRNLAGTAREASGRWEGRGDGLSRFRLRYREPWIPFVPIGIEGSLNHDVKTGVYSFTVWEIRGDLEILNGWRVGLGRGGSHAVETGKGTVDEGFFTAHVELDRRDSAILPTDGFRAAVKSRRGEKEERPEADSLSVRVNRMHWDALAEGYERFGRIWLGTARARFQFLDSPEDSLPPWDLFPIGGATSLRGYREEQFLTAGAVTLQTEWQWLHGGGVGSALYVFADLGLLRRETAGRARWDEFLLGSGVGIRQATRVGVLGLEYGVALSEGPLDGRIHLRLDAAF
jgi:outer membrane protein assembly factor BamA